MKKDISLEQEEENKIQVMAKVEKINQTNDNITITGDSVTFLTLQSQTRTLQIILLSQMICSKTLKALLKSVLKL